MDSQLLLGTLKLAGTDVQAQVDALVKQIAAAMTPEQIKAIAGMKITRETSMTIMQELGITMGGPPPGPGNAPGGDNPPPQGGQQPP